MLQRNSSFARKIFPHMKIPDFVLGWLISEKKFGQPETTLQTANIACGT